MAFRLCTSAVDTSSIPQVPQLELDLDNDGVINGEEIINCENTKVDAVIAGDYCPEPPAELPAFYNTDAYSADTDKDGMPDGYEINFGLNPISKSIGLNIAADGDFDGDGVSNLDEATLQLSPLQSDSDDDGISDLWESYFYRQSALVSDTPEQYIRPALADNSCDADYGCDGDNDSLLVLDEISYFSATCSVLYDLLYEAEEQAYANVDAQGAIDDGRLTSITPDEFEPNEHSPQLCEEMRTKLTDISQGEVERFSPDLVRGFDESEHFLVSLLNPDSDRDGINDGVEHAYVCLDPSNAISSIDPDKDSISSVDELAIGTDPCDIDTDGDSINDGIEVIYQLDPLDNNDGELDLDNDGISNKKEFLRGTFIDSDDSDNDGVTDNRDAFPLDATESVDTDGDGIGNNRDTDDDNDGVADSDDAFPYDPSESIDTDGDGIGNNKDIDDDNDGIPDKDDSEPLNAKVGDTQAPVIGDVKTLIFEATAKLTEVSLSAPEVTDNNLNAPRITSDLVEDLAIGEHVITWTATDFAGNKASKEQLIAVVDTTGPKFADVMPLILNSQGRLTDITTYVEVIAVDLVDGELNASITGSNVLSSGRYVVKISASDETGNIATANLDVDVLPELSIVAKKSVEAGGSYQVAVSLSGKSPHYPVDVSYKLTNNGQLITDNSLAIISGTQGEITIVVPENVLASDSLNLSLVSAKNAFIASNSQSQLSIIEHNATPLLEVQVSQQNRNVSVVDPDNGLVTIVASIKDINQNDTHNISWATPDNALAYIASEDNSLIVEVDPSTLDEGAYSVNIIVKESNTQDLLSVNQTVQFVVEQLNGLTIDTDSDNDGIADTDEGYGDSDGDGIADYLDNDSNISRLPSAVNTEPMQTSPGLTMSLGSLVQELKGSTSKNASLTMADLAQVVAEDAADTQDNHYMAASPLYNFTVDGLTQVGDSVTVVIPLAAEAWLPEGAIYRKYNTVNGWYSFVENENNSISSALTDESGNCPAANDASYSLGLTPNDNCIQLIIEDGGANDADFAINGMVEDPGVLAIEQRNQPPVIDLASSFEVNEETVMVLDASNSIDAEGDEFTYLWQQKSGTSVELREVTHAQLSFTSPSLNQDEVLTFELTLDDGISNSTRVTNVTVYHVNKAPVVSINEHQNSYIAGSAVTLTTQASDPDEDVITYIWQQISGPSINFEEVNAEQVSFILPEVTNDEVIKVQVTVSDSALSTTSLTSMTISPEAKTSETPVERKGSGWWCYELGIVTDYC